MDERFSILLNSYFNLFLNNVKCVPNSFYSFFKVTFMLETDCRCTKKWMKVIPIDRLHKNWYVYLGTDRKLCITLKFHFLYSMNKYIPVDSWISVNKQVHQIS